MLTLRYEDRKYAPRYMSAWSAGADLMSRIDTTIAAGDVAKVPTGVWIASYEEPTNPNRIPELQVRARSSLALKHSVALANGVGTVDLDYPDEICVLLHNYSKADFTIKNGDRIAQLVLNFAERIPGVEVVNNHRIGGFGSTGAR